MSLLKGKAKNQISLKLKNFDVLDDFTAVTKRWWDLQRYYPPPIYMEGGYTFASEKCIYLKGVKNA